MFSFANLILVAFSSVFVAGVFGTHLHPNAGCINVDDQLVCHPHTVTVSDGTATIWAQFDSGNHNPTQVAGCRLDAMWPSYYGEVFFGEDNCFYDAKAQVINGQCCINGSGGNVQVLNPYVL